MLALSGPNFSEETIFASASSQPTQSDPDAFLTPFFKSSFQLNGKLVIGMDVAGALGGAYSGAAGGPALAVAGALLGSSALSLRSMVRQAFKWWIFG